MRWIKIIKLSSKLIKRNISLGLDFINRIHIGDMG
jgi:hypothetical protein